MAKKVFERLGNTKTRTLLLFGGVVLVVAVLIIIMTTKKTSPLKTEESHAAKIPQITSVPGNVTSQKYQELQEKENRLKAEEAKKTGGSAVATIIGSQGKDSLNKKETFGIEGIGDCACPPSGISATPILDPALSSRLIAQIEANPAEALRLMKTHPGLAKALCSQKPDLALKVIENDKEAARIMLKECPSMAKSLAEKNPALFNQLVAEDPEIAKNIRDLMKSDPDFADQIAKTNPEMIKQFMKDDPEFAKAFAQNNPGMVKKFMLDDPAFANAMALKNPEMVKNLMLGDPAFARSLAEKNPKLVQRLMLNDPAFAAAMVKQNPDMVKKLMLDDPEFAKAFAAKNPELVATLMKDDPEFAKALRAKIPDIDKIIAANLKNPAFLTDKDRIAALEEARNKQKELQSQKSQHLRLSELQQKQLAAIIASMESQSKDAFKAWNEITPQQYVQGPEEKDTANGGAGGPTTGPGGIAISSNTSASAAVLVKAGTILYAVLDTAINSDEAGPVMATITAGKYLGGKAIGSITLGSAAATGGRPEKVIVNFTTLTMPDDPTSKSLAIQGVAIDMDTARTALASDVDHHYLLRYGTLFASSFITGYSKVITSQGTVQTTSNPVGATTTTTPMLRGRKEIFAALGEVGKQFGAAWASYFNTPNTITVDEGTGLGILILADVTN